MASPIGNPSNLGNGYDQIRAQVIGWIRTEIQASRTGGIGLHVDGATGDLIFRERGALVVDDSDGTEIAVIGNLGARVVPKVDGSVQKGWILRRDSGEPAASCKTNVVGGLQSWDWDSRVGDGIVSDDAVSGDALATPWLPLGAFMPADATRWPSTAAAIYTDIYVLGNYRQHPKLLVFGYVYAPVGTNGSIRVTVGGTVLGTPVAIVGSGAVVSFQIGPVATVPGWHTYLDIRLQAKVTAGAGTLALVPILAIGTQS